MERKEVPAPARHVRRETKGGASFYVRRGEGTWRRPSPSSPLLSVRLGDAASLVAVDPALRRRAEKGARQQQRKGEAALSLRLSWPNALRAMEMDELGWALSESPSWTGRNSARLGRESGLFFQLGSLVYCIGPSCNGPSWSELRAEPKSSLVRPVLHMGWHTFSS